jgi:MoaA/NifB/PqqE/SkfB family radical SAM enzyme
VIRFVDVAVGSGVVTRCTRCAPESVDTSFRAAGEIVAEAASVCESWNGGTGPNIRLTGAEPFAHPELPRIVAGVVAAGCARLGVDTDAVAFSSEVNARGALRAGVRHVRFTLLAGTPGVHDALAGAPGLLDATQEGVQAFRAAADAEGVDVAVTARIPVCRHDLRDLPSAVGAAVSCGADAVEVAIEDGGIDLAAAVPWVTAACDTGVVNGVWVQVAGMPFCLLPGYDLHLADVLGERAGAKQPVCGECALDDVCGGAPVGASADQLSLLAPPEGADALAAKVRRGRGTGER